MKLRRAVGYAAVIAPALDLTSDAMEWRHGGFTPLQRPRISPLGWIGACLGALAFTSVGLLRQDRLRNPQPG